VAPYPPAEKTGSIDYTKGNEKINPGGCLGNENSFEAMHGFRYLEVAVVGHGKSLAQNQESCEVSNHSS
jgi:hypothetical protein